MKIGLSYSRCVRDIIDGGVNIDDILIIISRTRFDPHNDEQWQGIWLGYGGGSGGSMPARGLFSGSAPEWCSYSAEDEQRFRDVSIALYDAGKLHQPRYFGASPARRPEIWLEAVLVQGDLDSNPAAKLAFEKFQTLASLSSVELNNNYQ